MDSIGAGRKFAFRYETPALLLPNQLAEVDVLYTTQDRDAVVATDVRTKRFGYSTGDLTHQKCTKEPQGPSRPGYFIDVDSIKHQDYSETCPYAGGGISQLLRRALCRDGRISRAAVSGSGRWNWDLLSVTPAGFTVKMCAQSQIRKLRKKHGRVSVNLVWNKYKTGTVTSDKTPASTDRTLIWSKSREFQLNPSTNSVSINVKYFDGSEKTFIGNDGDRFVDVDWNFGTKQLLLTPK